MLILFVIIIEGLGAQPTYVEFQPVFRVCSDLSEFLHVNFNSIEKHCSVIFSADLCFILMPLGIVTIF